jgi:plasmid stabilization system protein ParE
MSVEWSEHAIEDIEHAASWLEERNPRAARELIEAVGDRVAMLDTGLLEGRAVIIDQGIEARRWPV